MMVNEIQLNNRWMKQTHQSRTGFTLVEMITVVVILAIAAMIVIPLSSNASSVQAMAAAEMVLADLEYARSMAMTDGQFYRVDFDASNESYRLEKKVVNQGWVVMTHPVTQQNYTFCFPDSQLDHVQISSVAFNTSCDTIGFDYLGSPYAYNGSTYSALNSGTIVLEAGTLTKTIRVEAVTGTLSID